MRVLVTYETAHGSTAQVAQAVAEVLRECGAEVTLARCRQVRAVRGYDAVVVGSPIWMGKWLKPAQRFLLQHQQALAQMPLACFCTSLSVASDDEAERRAITEKCIPAILASTPALQPLDFASFAGVLNYPKYNPLLRAAMRSLMKRGGHPTEGAHDFRDWQAIRAWARRIHEDFVQHIPPG